MTGVGSIVYCPPPPKLTGSAALTSLKSFTAFSRLSVFPRLSCHKVQLLVAHSPPSSDVCFYTSCHCRCHTNTRGCGIKPYSLFRLIYTNMQQHKGGFRTETKLSAFPDWGLRAQREGKKPPKKQEDGLKMSHRYTCVCPTCCVKIPPGSFFYFFYLFFAQLGEEEGKERKSENS